MKKILLALYILFASFATNAQIDNTMYYMDRLPQSSYLNPANTPECKFYIGGLIIPVAGQLPPPITLAMNTPFDFNDVIYKGRFDYSDSLVTPLHPTENINDFFKKLKPVNYTTFDFQLSILQFGFKQGDNNYFTFDWTERTNIQFGFPTDLLRFPLLGNGELREATFDGLHINATQYRQIAIGYKRQVSRYLSAGVRLKFLTGVANINTSKSTLQVKTAEDDNKITATAAYEIHTNAPLQVTLDSAGYVDFSNIETTVGDSPDVVGLALLTGNMGYAIDLGFSKDWNSELTYYASIEDLGFIRWKTTPNTFTSQDAEFTFDGVELLLNPTDYNAPNFDSLINNASNISYSQESYTTWLPMKVYAGVRYKMTPKLWIGGVGRFEKLTFGWRPSYTGSMNFRPGKYGQFTLTYSYINRNFNNIGFGYAFPLGPFQWYMVTDNLIGTALKPDNSRSLSLRMGCNLIFGYKPKEGKRAMPLFSKRSTPTGRKLPKSGYSKPNRKGKNNGTRAKQKKKSAIGAPRN